MNTRINVLDKGFVRLVSYMQPVPEIIPEFVGSRESFDLKSRLAQPEGWTGDLEVVRNARVSYNADWRTGEDENSDHKLIHSMTNRHHTSPFEAMVFTFEVYAPIFVYRQWQRHRTWSYNEQSARYANMNDDFYIPDYNHITGQHATDKQMRSDDRISDAVKAGDLMSSVSMACRAAYEKLLQMGVARELARLVMPVNTYSRMFCTVDLHNLRHFLTLRQDQHAQYEIRVYADALHQLVSQVCPVSMAAFDAKREADAETRWLLVDTENALKHGDESGILLGLMSRIDKVLRALGLRKG